MDNLKFNTMAQDDNWRTQSFRQNVVSKIEEAIHMSGVKIARNSSNMENHVYMKAKTREEYMNMVAGLILHVREMAQQNKEPGGPNMSNQSPSGPPPQVSAQQGPAPGPGPQPGMAQDPINALQNLASQGSRNQMINMGQGGVMGPNPGMGMGQMGQQGQMPQGPQAQAATNLLQSLNQRPQMNMQQMQNKLGAPMGMVPNQGQMNMGNPMGSMGNPMGSQLQNQLAGPGMQGQMMPNMSMPNNMQGPMSGSNAMGGQMPCNQVVGGMGGQMPPNGMQGQMGMGGNQMNMNPMGMMHMQGRVPNKEMLGPQYAARAPPPNQFLRLSPSPSAPSPGMGGPSPSMGMMGGTMPSPMSQGVMGCGGVGSPSPSAPSLPPHHPASQRGVTLGLAASPAGGAGGASPGGEDVACRERVRQLSGYIEPLQRMVLRMVNDGENVEKLHKMKNLLDILSNPNKRVPLETLIKCEVVLEKLDFKRNEGPGLGPQPNAGKEQIFNPLLEMVNMCLQSPLANHTLKRTFGSALEALDGPDIKNLPPPMKISKVEEPPMEIPEVLQGEIARLDSRFKVSLDTMQLAGEEGAISLYAQLDSAKLPCVPPLLVTVPRQYPAVGPSARLKATSAKNSDPSSFLNRLQRAMEARCKRLPKSCSVGQLLDAWEMSVRQACAPHPTAYTPVPALGY